MYLAEQHQQGGKMDVRHYIKLWGWECIRPAGVTAPRTFTPMGLSGLTDWGAFNSCHNLVGIFRFNILHSDTRGVSDQYGNLFYAGPNHFIIKMTSGSGTYMFSTFNAKFRVLWPTFIFATIVQTFLFVKPTRFFLFIPKNYHWKELFFSKNS